MQNQYFNRVQVSESSKRFVDNSLQLTDKIIRLLKVKGLSVQQLADALGKEESHVSKWLTGLHNFDLNTISKIEGVLGEAIHLKHNLNH